MFDFTWFLTTTISHLSNYLASLTLLFRSQCISLLSDTKMLNSSIFLYRIGYTASKWSNACYNSEVPSLELSGESSILNGNSLPMATTDKAISVPSTCTTFKFYSAKNTPWNHWWRLILSTEFILCTFFKYWGNPSFLISLWLPLATAYTRSKHPSAFMTIIFGRLN